MKMDKQGTLCERCEKKIRWWHEWFRTTEGRNLHTDCFAEEVMVDRIIQTAEKMRLHAKAVVAMDRMASAPAKIRGTNISSFRPNEWATITAVKMTTPEGLKPRPGFECTYDDGFIDYIPVEDSDNYEIGG